MHLLVSAIQARLKTLGHELTSTAELLEISNQLQHLEIDLRQISKFHRMKKKIIPVSSTCEVSIAEVLQARIDSSHKILNDKLRSILKETSDVEAKKNLEEMLEGLEESKNKSEEMVTIFEENNAILLKKIEGYASTQNFKNRNDFRARLTAYADDCRKLSNKLEFKCVVYDAHSPTLQKDIAKDFFQKAMDKGYDLEQSHITINDVKFNFATTFKEEESKDLISRSKNNARQLLKQSHIIQLSNFDDTKDEYNTFQQLQRRGC
jgi:hypothetical protein